SGTPLLRGGSGLFCEYLLRYSPPYHAAVLGLSLFRHISRRSCLRERPRPPNPGPDAATCGDVSEVGLDRVGRAALRPAGQAGEHRRGLAPRRRWPAGGGVPERPPHPLRGERRVDVAHAEVAE